MCVDGDLETMCTTNRKAYSSITLDFGKPVEIAKVTAHKDHRCLIEKWKKLWGRNNQFFAGQSCSKLQTPKDVFSKDCHRQRDCAKWITCQWRYWSCYSFSKVFSSGFEVEGYDTQLMSISPEFQAVGQYLIIQRDQSVGGRNAALSAIEVIAYCPGSNVPNSPEKPSEGDLEPWTPGFPHWFFYPGDSSCSGGKALVPDSITMSSRKRQKLGEDKCTDGNKETVCTTKSEPYPSITLDFGHPVHIAQVISLSFPLIFYQTHPDYYAEFWVTWEIT